MWENTSWTRLPAFAENIGGIPRCRLDKVSKKHIATTTAQALLAMATYLDPRFRTQPALSMAQQSVAEWAWKTQEAGPELEARKQEVAAHHPAAHGRGRSHGQNRGRKARRCPAEARGQGPESRGQQGGFCLWAVFHSWSQSG